MAEAPFMPFATDAFVADTTALDDAETGAYMMLLVDLWRSDTGTLPLDHKKLARTARCEQADWPARWDAIKGYFTVADGVISQARVLRDRAKVRAKIEKARDNGKKGGRPKLSETNENKPTGYDPVNQNLTQKKTNQNHNHIREEYISSSQPLPREAAAAESKSEGEVEDWVRIGTWAIHTAGLANTPRPVTFTVVKDWLANGWTETQIKAGISAVTARPNYQPPRSLKFFEEAIREANPASADPPTYCRSFVADFNEERWRGALYQYAIGKPWPYGLYGPPINQPGTLVWPFLIEVYRAKFGSLEPGVLVPESEVA